MLLSYLLSFNPITVGVIAAFLSRILNLSNTSLTYFTCEIKIPFSLFSTSPSSSFSSQSVQLLTDLQRSFVLYALIAIRFIRSCSSMNEFALKSLERPAGSLCHGRKVNTNSLKTITLSLSTFLNEETEIFYHHQRRFMSHDSHNLWFMLEAR